MQNFGQTRLES